MRDVARNRARARCAQAQRGEKARAIGVPASTAYIPGMPIEVADRRNADAPARSPPIGRALLASAALCLVAAGSLLWWRNGAAVFSDMVLGALAWCF
jgi:hypothetical protein